MSLLDQVRAQKCQCLAGEHLQETDDGRCPIYDPMARDYRGIKVCRFCLRKHFHGSHDPAGGITYPDTKERDGE